jgi:hypothetical protein
MISLAAKYISRKRKRGEQCECDSNFGIWPWPNGSSIYNYKYNYPTEPSDEYLILYVKEHFYNHILECYISKVCSHVIEQYVGEIHVFCCTTEIGKRKLVLTLGSEFIDNDTINTVNTISMINKFCQQPCKSKCLVKNCFIQTYSYNNLCNEHEQQWKDMSCFKKSYLDNIIIKCDGMPFFHYSKCISFDCNIYTHLINCLCYQHHDEYMKKYHLLNDYQMPDDNV